MKKLLILCLSLMMMLCSVGIVEAKEDKQEQRICYLDKDYNILTKTQYTTKQQKELDNAVNKIISGISSSMTTVEKLMYVHDYMLLNIQYDYDNYLEGDIPYDSFTPYGALVKGYAVCQGYADAYTLIMKTLGVECVTVQSWSMNHAWNLVKVDGKWYHVDVTWDDPVYDKIGRAYHDFFLLSDEEIKRREHYGWSTSYKCTSTIYDDAFWQNSKYAFYIVDGWWYHIDYDGVIYKSKGLNTTRYKYMDISEYSDYQIDGFITDGKYFYIALDVNHSYGDIEYDLAYIKRIRLSDKYIETVFKKEGSIYGILYKDGKYYYEEESYKEFNHDKVIEKAVIHTKIDSLELLLSDDSSYSGKYLYEIYEKETLFSMLKCYVENPNIAEIVDDRVVGKSIGKTRLVIESENGIKKYVDLNIVNTILDFWQGTDEVIFVDSYLYISYIFEMSNGEGDESVLTATIDNKSLVQVLSPDYIKALKPGVFTLTVKAPDNTTKSKSFKIVDKTGWHEFNGHKYYMCDNQNLAYQFINIDNNTYYFEDSGRMYTGWFKKEIYDNRVNDWVKYNCYFDNNGIMYKGWKVVDDTICYFNETTGNLEKKITDVKSGKWYFNTVYDALTSGLMSGTGETTFLPDDNMTRGMIVTVLHRIAGKPNVAYTGKFKDVSQSSYCATAVEWAAKNKVVSGYSNGKFGPNDNITRQDVAVILYNYARSLGLDVTNDTNLSKFADYKNVSSYAKPAMQWAVSVGILSGSTKDGKTYLNPKANATRAECAKMLLTASKIYKK